MVHTVEGAHIYKARSSCPSFPVTPLHGGLSGFSVIASSHSSPHYPRSPRSKCRVRQCEGSVCFSELFQRGLVLSKFWRCCRGFATLQRGGDDPLTAIYIYYHSNFPCVDLTCLFETALCQFWLGFDFGYVAAHSFKSGLVFSLITKCWFLSHQGVEGWLIIIMRNSSYSFTRSECVPYDLLPTCL